MSFTRKMFRILTCLFKKGGGGLFSILVQNCPKVTKKVLVFRKVARSCSLTKKLLKILKVAKKLPSRIWKGLFTGYVRLALSCHLARSFSLFAASWGSRDLGSRKCHVPRLQDVDKELLLLIRRKNRTRRKAKLKYSVNFGKDFVSLDDRLRKCLNLKSVHLTKLTCFLRDNPRSPQSRSLFSASLQTFCLSARAYLNTKKYGLFCSLVIKRLPKLIEFPG